jgi:hypothetical protein
MEMELVEYHDDIQLTDMLAPHEAFFIDWFNSLIH